MSLPTRILKVWLSFGFTHQQTKLVFLIIQFLPKETQRLIQEPVPGISATPDESNARYFHVLVSGPSEVYQIS